MTITDTAGPLPSATANGQARQAALADLPAPLEGNGTVEYASHGRLLVIGAEKPALDAAERLSGQLEVYVLLTDDAGPGIGHPDTGRLGSRVRRARRLGVAGHLGAFRVIVSDGGAERDLAAHLGLGVDACFDLVLDLDDPPAIVCEKRPPGYCAGAVAGELAHALVELPELVGEFEKPRYFQYDAEICVHGNRGQRGCTRCLDACATEAIRSVGETIEVDPYLCQGCGSCATVCPTGAIAYAWPPAERLLDAVRGLLRRYAEAGGQHPTVLFHDAGAGADALEEWAGDLPESVLPVPVEDVGGVGPDTWLATLAYGAGRVLLVVPADVPPSERAATLCQVRDVNAILLGLGHSAERVATLDPDGDVRALAEVPDALVAEAATFAGLGGKRAVMHQAIEHLHAQAGAPEAVAPLDEGAPFGAISVDPDACTLCMACVSVCPPQAVLGGQDQPRLLFREDRCVQCGLCEATCPEDAIRLVPQMDFAAHAVPVERLLHAEEMHHCPDCGKAFATRKIIARMEERLAGHWMFRDEQARRRLYLCEDCRIRAVLSDEGSVDPYRH